MRRNLTSKQGFRQWLPFFDQAYLFRTVRAIITPTMALDTNPLLFLKRFFLAPKTVGAIAPTSLTTARIMTEPIRRDAKVLEIGAGTGIITHAILERINDPHLLTSVEIDSELAKHLQQQFPTINIQVEDVEQTLQSEIQYDIIISGIPFVSMDKDKRDRVFKLIKERLHPNGLFIAFQYSLYTKNELTKLFSKVEIKFSPLNLPPAFIYFCKKT